MLSMKSSRKEHARSSWLRRTVLAAVGCVLSYSALGHQLASAQVEYLGSTQLSGKTTDRSGLSGLLETNTPIDAFGGLSAIDYTGSGNRYVVVSDRGAGDGAASFPCRFHTVVLNVDPKTRNIQFQLEATTMLRDANGQAMTGSLSVLKAWDKPERCPSYDPEGIRYLGNSGIVISDEYGPNLDQFSNEGHLIKSFALPPGFALSEKLSPPFEQGAYSNRGLEGVAVSPDGKTIVGAMQGPLVQDGRIEKKKCLGVWTRWIAIDTTTSKTKQLAYRLDDESTGISELLSVDATRYLVLERDSNSGQEAKIKRIYLADATGASDISQVPSMRQGLDTQTTPIRKTLLIDLLDPAYGFAGANAPEKPEGIAWGPKLADGRRLLIICFDNDFEPEIPTIFVAFAVSI
jgi:hypothetical protein